MSDKFRFLLFKYIENAETRFSLNITLNSVNNSEENRKVDEEAKTCVKFPPKW